MATVHHEAIWWFKLTDFEPNSDAVASAPATARSSSRLHGLFYGDFELRPGWRLMIFVVLVAGLTIAKAVLIRILPSSSDQSVTYLVDKILKFAVFLLASWTMARIEARKISDYGLPWRQMFRRQFWSGAMMAFLGLTGFLTVLRLAGLFRFGAIVLRGSEIWEWAALYAFGFIIVALEEEFHYRGYGLYTFTQGIGFWPRRHSLISSIWLQPHR